MQIHIHKDGKNYGPYPLEQARQYLKAGNFSGNDHAYHDGANWIKLSQVPGIAPSKPKTVAKQVEQPLGYRGNFSVAYIRTPSQIFSTEN